MEHRATRADEQFRSVGLVFLEIRITFLHQRGEIEFETSSHLMLADLEQICRVSDEIHSGYAGLIRSESRRWDQRGHIIL